MVAIAISGLSGTGKTTVAKELARRLGYDYFSVTESLKEMSTVKGELLRVLDIWKRGNITKNTQLKIENLQLQMANKNEVVIDGEITIHILRNTPAFKVLLTADPQVRIERIAKRDSLSIKEAQKFLEEKENIEEMYFKKFYGISLKALETYADFVIDTTTLPVEEIVNSIIRVMPK